jgi:YegS/Rv2252/BmrU family lipid kinase
VIAAIVNPRAGSGAAGRRWPLAARLIGERVGPVKAFFTEAPGHGTALARQLVNSGYDVILVAGGDGTLNEAANGLLSVSSRARLALLPLASGGDFARMLGIADLASAVDALVQGECRPIDAFRARFHGPDSAPAERCFVNVASFGLGALAAARARRWRRIIRGRAGYLAATLPTLAAAQFFRVSLGIDGAPPAVFDITTAAVANGQYQGGGIRIAPEAVLDDGRADVTVVERVSLAEVVRRLPILYNGALYSHPNVRHWRASRVCVHSDGAVPLELDGEPVGALPLEIEALPGALRVLRPAR